jgi:hypothetical protein
LASQFRSFIALAIGAMAFGAALSLGFTGCDVPSRLCHADDPEQCKERNRH